MKKVIVCVFALLATFSIFAHTLKSQDNFSVSHMHRSACDGGCVTNESAFAQAFNFSLSDQVNGPTKAYNCHSRTFDARRSWVNYSDMWVFGSGNMSVSSPQIGDVVVWFEPGASTSGTVNSTITTHTARIVLPWNGSSTKVASKYGAQGEYVHSLANTINVYGSNYKIIRLGTYSFPSLTSSLALPEYKIQVADEMKSLGKTDDSEWKTKFKKLDINLTSKRGSKKVDILISDLLSKPYYVFELFNHPSHTRDLVTEIESGLILIELAEKNQKDAEYIIAKLREIVESKTQDPYRGIAYYFMHQIEQKTGVQSGVDTSQIQYEETVPNGSYLKYYVEEFK